jgi:hypothetical protein
MSTSRLATLALICVSLAFSVSHCRSEEVAFESILRGLHNPCGVTVQPDTGHVFVAESGAGRIIRVVDGRAEDVIVDFPLDEFGDGPKYTIGPLGLIFQDARTLIVGGGGMQGGDELVRIYEVPDAGSPAIPSAKMKNSLGPLAASADVKGEGNFHAVAVTPAAVFVTCSGDDEKGWIAKADIATSGYSKLERFVATKEAVHVDAPVGLTIGPGGDVVVGQMGEINVPRDGLLSFYHAKTGRLRMNLELQLFDVTGLAYSTRHADRLYAVDFAWMDLEKGGLYRLDAVQQDGKQAVKAVLMAALERPTALAFAPDGTLYVTVIGPIADSPGAPEGRLVKFAPGL